MPTTNGSTSLKKDMKDVGAGLLVATASTVMLRLLGRRGRVARTVLVAAASAGTALLRHRFMHERTTTHYALTREVTHKNGSGDE
jgi:hypothetical protein